MESQAKTGFNGTQGVAREWNDVKVATKASTQTPVFEYILRLVAIATTLVAAILMGSAKETTTVSVDMGSAFAPLSIVATAKSTYSSAFVYFVVANVIACAYSILSLAISIASNAGKKKLAVPISIADLVVVALLFSGNGAAAAIGVLGQKGNSHVGWNKVCNVFGKFCAHAMASIVVSLLGSLAYVLLLLLSLISLHKRSS